MCQYSENSPACLLSSSESRDWSTIPGLWNTAHLCSNLLYLSTNDNKDILQYGSRGQHPNYGDDSGGRYKFQMKRSELLLMEEGTELLQAQRCKLLGNSAFLRGYIFDSWLQETEGTGKYNKPDFI